METQATRTEKKATKRAFVPMNGVDTPTLIATVNAVAAQPDLGRFTFRASNRWIAGTHSRTRIEKFDGAGGQHEHASQYTFEGDHPVVLVGTDRAPTPVEFLLHALATCITAGIGNIASARGIELTEVESTVEGNIDIRGLLGITDEVRNGYQGIKATFRIKGNGTPEQLAEIVRRSQARSAVFDVLTNGVPVSIDVVAG